MSRLLALLVCLGSALSLAAPPRLTVFIAVDALGSDLVLKNKHRFRDGLAQLLSGGAYYPIARYGYAQTVTAAGHATLATGANPWRHGAIGNRLFNRVTGKFEPVFADPAHPALESPLSAEDVSPVNLHAETLSDRLRQATDGKGRSIALSGKGRSSVAMAGRLGTAYWFNETVGKLVTGTAYTKELPAWVRKFNERKLADAAFSKPWTLSAPVERFTGEDDRPFETDVNGMGRVFPHALNGGLTAPGSQSYSAFADSPGAADYLVQAAKAAIEGEGLGKDDKPDILWVGFSNTDSVYHAYGPNSWEMQDTLLRLDKSVGELLAAAEKSAGGRQNLLVVLSADHGGGPIPEEWAAMGLPSKRLSSTVIRESLGREMKQYFGSDLLAAIHVRDVFLNHKMISDRRLDPAAIRRTVADWFNRQAWVALALTREDLMGRTDLTGLGRTIQLGYFPGRSGDVVYIPKPFMVTIEEATGTSHGTPYGYDSEVPLVFYGKGVKRGVYPQYADPVEVAPTMASILEMAGPSSSEGKPRIEILAAPGAEAR